MGMNVGSAHGPSDEPETMMDINTTPLIDVMLVLLVMLIVTIPIQLHAVNMEMPLPSPPPPVKPAEININIDPASQVYWQGMPVTMPELDKVMRETAEMASQPVIKIRPDKNSQYAVFANVLSSTKRIGLTKVAVLGAEQFVQ